MKDGKYFDIFEGNAFSRYIYIYIEPSAQTPRNQRSQEPEESLSPTS